VPSKKRLLGMGRFFLNYFGAANEVTTITESKWEGFFVHIRGQQYKPHYQKKLLDCGRSIINYFAEKRLLTAPLNLNSKSLKIKEQTTAIKTTDIGTVK